MADLHFPAELPVAEIRGVISAVRSGDFVSAEVIDSGLWSLGCLNALRGPTPFGATADGPDFAGKSDAELCDLVEAKLPVGVGAAGDEAETIPPILIPIVAELVLRLVSRLFGIGR